jgi:LPXTG-site transpeptidase (sortase) family protein
MSSTRRVPAPLAWLALLASAGVAVAVLTGMLPAGPAPAGTPDTIGVPAAAEPRPGAVGTVPPATAPAAPPASYGKPSAVPRPVALRIPSADVDAPVLPVGVREGDAVDVPEDARTVGWYRYGVAPGAAEGSAVLVGHVDSIRQGKGELFKMLDVEVGARIEVERADGSRLSYRVTSVEKIEKRRLPAEELFARDGPPVLTLITCGGPFDPDRGGYRDNVVVTGVPERS